jgi:hypothetical protein
MRRRGASQADVGSAFRRTYVGPAKAGPHNVREAADVREAKSLLGELA